MTAIYVLSPNGTKTRIFSSPSEYLQFRDELNDQYRKICDAGLHSGVRPIELRRLHMHPEWFDKTRHLINLGPKSLNKGMAKKARTVLLTLNGAIAIEKYFALELDVRKVTVPTNAGPKKVDFCGPTDSAWFQALALAAKKSHIDGGATHLSQKSLRKTLASWLILCGESRDIMTISKSMGHSPKTLQECYLGLGFMPKEKEEIAEFLKGWGGLL